MIPTDIETTVQWRVRHQTPDGTREMVRTGTETQVRSIAERMAAHGAVVEVRTITVGEWRDPQAPEEAPDEADE